jgi:hypothetical protein
VAKPGRDDLLIHAIFAGAGGGGIPELMEPSIGVDLGCGQDSLIFA